LGKKRLSASPNQVPHGIKKIPHKIMNFFGGRPKFGREKGTFLKKQYIFLRETYVLKLFAITTISCLFLYRLIHCYWKGLEDGYNFVIAYTSIKFTYKNNN
jgi:hypothetical protein